MELKTIEEHLKGHTPKRPEPIVAGLLFRKTMAVLGAPDDSFKTNWAIQLAVSVAAGIPFLSYSCRKSRVVYVVLEGGQDYILERFEEKVDAMGVDKNEVMKNVYVMDCTGCQLDDENELKEVENAIDKVSPSPDLVILDPITYALNEDVRFSPKKTELSRKMLGNTELWDNVTLLVVHCRKDAQDNDSTDDFLGSGVLSRAAATRIKLFRFDETKVNMYSKTRHAERPDELQLQMHYPLLIVGGHDLSPRNESVRLVLESLKERSGEIGLSELVEEIHKRKKYNGKTVRAAIDNLQLEGKVQVERLPKSAKKVVRLAAPEVVQAS